MTWSSDKYLAKSQIYWQRATDKERDSEEFLLNVSFFIEFLVRGCLCKVNPSLNSASDEESLLFSVGLMANKLPKTVKLNLAIERLVRLSPSITSVEKDSLLALITLRNQELHGDDCALSDVSQEDIMPRIFSACVKIADSSSVELSSVFTASDAVQARSIADALKKDRQKRVRSLIRVQKERFFGQTAETQVEKKREKDPTFISAVTSSNNHLIRHKCPCCAGFGIVSGVPVGRSSPILREDGVYQEIRILPNVFECKCCELKINGLDELMVGGIPHEFNSLDEMDLIEHFSIDPMEYIDTEEIVREYGREMYEEYMDE